MWCRRAQLSLSVCTFGEVQLRKDFLRFIPELIFEPSISHWFRTYTISWRPLLQPYKVFSHTWCRNWVVKRPFLHSIRPCFRVMEKMVRPVNFMDRSQLPQISCCKISFLVRSNVIWHICWWKRYFIIPWIVIFGKIIVGRKSKPLSRIPVYSREKTILPLPWWKCGQHAITRQLVSLRSGTTLRTQCWFLLLVFWALSGWL